MTAALDLLDLARRHGIELALTGESIRLRAPAAPPPEVVDELREHKADLLALLRPAGADAPTISPAKWGDDADGPARLGTMPPPDDVERFASEAVITRWINEHPPAYADQDHCAACGGRLLDDFLPLAERDVHGQTVWVHASGGCWREYVSKRRAEAEAAVHR